MCKCDSGPILRLMCLRYHLLGAFSIESRRLVSSFASGDCAFQYPATFATSFSPSLALLFCSCASQVVVSAIHNLVPTNYPPFHLSTHTIGTLYIHNYGQRSPRLWTGKESPRKTSVSVNRPHLSPRNSWALNSPHALFGIHSVDMVYKHSAKRATYSVHSAQVVV